MPSIKVKEQAKRIARRRRGPRKGNQSNVLPVEQLVNTRTLVRYVTPRKLVKLM